eukprot:TRINITY_DN34355_c0_g1_i1.p1 TRINITY_DN34355_c0_g1~~TRINITY_DN34355_c0_g1_i1.p1  ORF type:complete len:128 (-),score=20.04 TRINITY_DN34355_c0_g1_i1:66-449(-)
MTTLRPSVTRTEVERHVKNGEKWLVIHGKVYDVTTYMQDHPGGDQTLLDHMTMEDVGEEFDLAGHGKFAREEMKRFYIADMIEDDEDDDDSLTIPFLKPSKSRLYGRFLIMVLLMAFLSYSISSLFV